MGRNGYTLGQAVLRGLLEQPGHFYELFPIAVLIGTIYALARLARAHRDQPMAGRTHGVQALQVTAELAGAWDGLKRSYRSGELVAWVGTHRPELALPPLPRPPREEEAELNEFLWALGHRGLATGAITGGGLVAGGSF